MAEIKGKGLPTRKTVGALGDIYVDTTTGVKYKCTGAFGVTTHAASSKEYEWKPANPVTRNLQRTAEEKPHETPKKQTKAKKVEEKVEEKVSEQQVKEVAETQPVKKETKSNGKHNYTKHFENGKDTE